MSEWQPITTAPRDEDPVLIYDPNAHHDGNGFAVASFQPPIPEQKMGEAWLGCDELSNWVEYHPTHWMPLPPPPSE